MVDTHYDLLTICYISYLRNNYIELEKIVKDIKNNNIKCVFANLYFMSKKEMEKLHKDYYKEDVSLLEMFKISKYILEYYLPNIDFIYSIEGCDYINETDLCDLYNEGLRSILLVWNNENIYGSGNRSNKGLTKEGISFINKVIDLNIGIDLSHCNESTFYGIIEVIKKRQRLGTKVICFASHSNSRYLYNIKRNLSDKELKTIKEVGGLVGVCSNKLFVNSLKEKSEYLKHIIYISKIIGIDNVMISTDDMNFFSFYNYEYKKSSVFNYSNIYEELKETLLKYFNTYDTYKIILGNAYNKIIKELKCK